MNYDKPLAAILIGLLTAIPLELYTQIFKYLGLNQLSAFELTSIMMYKQGNWWIGLLTFTGTCALATLSIYELGRKLGTDYLPLKSAGFAMVTYGLLAAIFGTLGRNPRFAELTVSGHYVQASTAFWGGILVGLLLKKYVINTSEITRIKKVRKYTFVPAPAMKKEKRRIKLVKPTKLYTPSEKKQH